ncbi:unnamed protein product, partial [Ectocarpus sp. 12 AP-2014]
FLLHSGVVVYGATRTSMKTFAFFYVACLTWWWCTWLPGAIRRRTNRLHCRATAQSKSARSVECAVVCVIFSMGKNWRGVLRSIRTSLSPSRRLRHWRFEARTEDGCSFRTRHIVGHYSYSNCCTRSLSPIEK